jgi:hypothetical protein
LETPPRKLKHKWVRRFEIDKEATGDNYTVCLRCGHRKNEVKKECKGVETKKPKA